jgi:hypothetical protein
MHAEPLAVIAENAPAYIRPLPWCVCSRRLPGARGHLQGAPYPATGVSTSVAGRRRLLQLRTAFWIAAM